MSIITPQILSLCSISLRDHCMLFNHGKLPKMSPENSQFLGKKRKKRNYPGLSLLFIRGMLTQGIVVRYLGRDAGLGFQQVLPVLRQIFDLAHEVDGQAAALGEGSEVFLT